ncbi:hypothetical protein NEUTE1DRAFT_117766 [Neurospora tetrasperma FGSC 2508]|uniref:Uncharacterized protein n=1 Tax=Neurospora tetrasperma (strain FGSC 2508 / ATCC MYA-4615 / P0657) TaxID=510951 RepID=F8MTT9_NEUT8|nr:uncharacterized protein NEUTE1DRAFT_117766 [Neurospora tetrasperma FGSC 2508]EGO55421.1 hypothetical protein NEUTE1DRAFT_117766 [Neurospora tetrasperma FGSC 2508]EGZ69352.1 hypothetical protein NEUTE2DRAFT_145524 [Neurospora tetrasperma FGSC 2509]
MFGMDCCRGEMTGRPSDEDHFQGAGRGIMLMYPDDTVVPSSSSSSPSNPFPGVVCPQSDLQSVS